MSVRTSARPRTLRLLAITLAALVGTAALATGCGSAIITPSGDVTTETRALDDFDEVVFEGFGTLKIVPGETASVKITADENFMPYAVAEVDANELKLGLDQRGRILNAGNGKLEFLLTAPSIDSITNSGSGSIFGGRFSGGQFTIVDSGSGSVELEAADVLSLSSTISGSGVVEILGGVAGAQVVVVSGSGRFIASDLDSKVATVKVSGSGSAEVWATEGLAATVSGSGNVSYWGSPVVTSDVSGSGEVKPLGDKP